MKKIRRYLSEIRFCLRCGATRLDSAKLALATIRFHLANALGHASPATDVSRKYRVYLEGHHLDLHLRTFSGDLFVFYEVFLDEVYRLPAEMTPPRVILDLGANVGLTALWFALRYREARVVCVEADPSNVGLLASNLRAFGDRVQILEGAIWIESGEVSFIAEGPAWRRAVTLGPGTSQPVKAYSPADIVRRFNLSHIDVLKVDIEGSEKAIIQKEGDFLKLAELMVIELHEGYGFDVFARDVGARGLRAYLPGQWKGNRMIVGVRGTE